MLTATAQAEIATMFAAFRAGITLPVYADEIRDRTDAFAADIFARYGADSIDEIRAISGAWRRGAQVVVSIDAESNGLGGACFAVGMTLSSAVEEITSAVYRCPIVGEVDPWVAGNVLPAIADVAVNCATYPAMIADVRATIDGWGGKAVGMIAHIPVPVEARLLADVYPGAAVWDAPVPLIDVGSVLLARGYDPMSVDGYLVTNALTPPDGSAHHPLFDAQVAALCFWHLMA